MVLTSLAGEGMALLCFFHFKHLGVLFCGLFGVIRKDRVTRLGVRSNCTIVYRTVLMVLNCLFLVFFSAVSNEDCDYGYSLPCCIADGVRGGTLPPMSQAIY